MNETNFSDFTRIATGLSTIDNVVNPFRRQQRRPSNLMQCMDKDGNIDAFRYIEYSKQRRMDFLKRANFICAMKSNLQQQRYPRSASLPGVTTMVRQPCPQPQQQQQHTSLSTVTPPTLISPTTSEATAAATMDNGMALWKAIEGVRRSNSHNNLSLSTALAARLMARSSSMPFVSAKKEISTPRESPVESSNHNARFPSAKAASADADSSSSAARRGLRKEEFEAAEALLFGMRRDRSSSNEEERVSKKRKFSKAPTKPSVVAESTPGGDTESATVVSHEEETSSNKQARLE